MRFHEIASGIQLPLSSEEKSILDRAEDGLVNADMDERDQEVAVHMTSRGLLKRFKDDKGRVAYRANSILDTWKDRD